MCCVTNRVINWNVAPSPKSKVEVSVPIQTLVPGVVGSLPGFIPVLISMIVAVSVGPFPKFHVVVPTQAVPVNFAVTVPLGDTQ